MGKKKKKQEETKQQICMKNQVGGLEAGGGTQSGGTLGMTNKCKSKKVHIYTENKKL